MVVGVLGVVGVVVVVEVKVVVAGEGVVETVGIDLFRH